MNKNINIKRIIDDLINNYENYNLEAKESSQQLSKDLWKTYSAFANTAGGIILLGVQQSKTDKAFSVSGVEHPEKLCADIFTIAQNKNKVSINLLENEDVKVHDIDGKKIISIYVREANITDKPVYLNGEDNYKNVYIRKYEGDCRATPEEYRRFIRNTQDNIDGQLLNNYTIDDLDTNSVLEFKNIVNLRYPSRKYLEYDNFKFLLEMGIFQIDTDDNRVIKLTLAGLLFLGKYSSIIRRLPHFHLEYLNKRCDETKRWKDRVSTGDLNYPDLNLFQFYKIVLEKLRATVDEPFELDEKCVRKTSDELEIALREALANTIIHADYLDAETNIAIVVDKLFYYFENPGTMKVSKEQFFAGGKSKPRNNILITFFRRIGASERAGSGGREIFYVIERNNFRDPELNTNLETTSLKLWCAAPEYAYTEYAEPVQSVLICIREHKIIQLKEIKAETQLSNYYIHKALKELLDNNLIGVTGEGRATRYFWKMSAVERVAQVQNITNIMLQK